MKKTVYIPTIMLALSLAGCATKSVPVPGTATGSGHGSTATGHQEQK